MAVFAGYDQQTLDREYDNRGKIDDLADIMVRWQAGGDEARRHLSCDLDVAYGDHPRQRLDIFPCSGRDRPVLVFIHGGYWHSRDKSLVHLLAPVFVAADIHFVSLGYRLCPEVTVADIATDVEAGLRWVAEHASGFGGAARDLYVAGHSAGGHLAAMMAGPAGVPELLKGACTISGLHDLEPIRLCYLNQELGLAADQVAALSPISLAAQIPTGVRLPPLIATVGMEEGPEYLRQRDQLVDALRQAGQPVESVDLPGCNHFNACEAFGNPHEVLCQAMLRLILAPSF